MTLNLSRTRLHECDPGETPRAPVPWTRIAAIAGLVVVFLWAAPRIERALRYGMLTMFEVIVMVTAGMLCGIFIPYAVSRVRRRMLRRRLDDAQRDPIEELQQELVERERELASGRGHLAQIKAQLEGVRDQVAEAKPYLTERDLAAESQVAQQLATCYAQGLAKLEAEALALHEFRAHVETKVREWRFAQAARGLLRQMDTLASRRVTRNLLHDTASQTVRREFQAAMAELEVHSRLEASQSERVVAMAAVGDR